MELVDLYDENRAPLGKTAERYGKKGPGEYRTVVHVCLFDSRGRLLIQKRTAGKRVWPEMWDVSVGGGVDAGETSRQGAEREFREELGYPLDLGGLRPAVTVNFGGGFDDFFILRRDVDIASFRLQAEEVSAVRWVTLPELLDMVDEGSFIPYPKSFLQFLFDMRDSFGFPTKKDETAPRRRAGVLFRLKQLCSQKRLYLFVGGNGIRRAGPGDSQGAGRRGQLQARLQ